MCYVEENGFASSKFVEEKTKEEAGVSFTKSDCSPASSIVDPSLINASLD